MISISQKIGRLAELRMTPPVLLEDLTSLQRDLSALAAKSASRLVVCGDLTAASVFSEALADRLARFFRLENQRLERVALVVGDGATFYLQVDRLLREGASPSSPGSRAEPSPPREHLGRNGAPGSDPLPAKRPQSSATSPQATPSSGGARTQATATGQHAIPSAAAVRAAARRAFRSPAEAMSWLDEILTPEERARLRTFFDTSRASPP